MPARRFWNRLMAMIVVLVLAASEASAGVILKLGDLLIAEPGAAAISVVDAVTGEKTTISQGDLLGPEWMTVGVALARDGDIIAVHRRNGLIRINPVTGAQSVLSQGGFFKDSWALAVDSVTGYIYVADSGYDNGAPAVNEAGKIVRVDPASGAQVLIASGSPCNVFPANAACQNTTSAGSYLSHPYGIAIDYTGVPGTLVVGDMGSFNGKGAIIRIQPFANGTQTLLWGPASAVPPPQVAQISPFGCPMGLTVEPNGNVLATVFTFPVPSTPTFPPPAGTYYGCAPPGIFRINLVSNVQSVLNTNAPPRLANHSYAVGSVIRDGSSSTSHVHRAISAGVSQGSTPVWNGTLNGTTADGSVVWQNVGPGASWLIPFGLDAEPAPTQANPSQYNIIVTDENQSRLFRLDSNGLFVASAPLAAGSNYVTSVDVITFTPPGGFKVEPIPSNGQPEGMLPAGTTETTISLTTDVTATCRYSVVAGVAYESMPNTFTTTGSTEHSTTVSGLANDTSYNFFVRCIDTNGSANTSDFTISFSVAPPPPPQSILPVAAYGFDEGSGTALVDRTAFSNNGTISGATWTAQGRFGSALSFDGVDDWVTVEDAPTLNLTTGMTLEAWVYPTAAAGSWRNVMIKERPSGEVYNLYANTNTNTPAVYVVRATPPGAALDLHGPSPLPLNAWTHLTSTYDGTTLRLYVNGVETANRVVGGSFTMSTGPLRMGGNSLWGEFFQGRLDEVRIYNRALSVAEILADMSSSVNESMPDTAPPFRFNGQPVGTLTWGTTQAVLSLSTSEAAVCRYSGQPGVSYASMTNTFTTTGASAHATAVTGLTNGGSYSFYIRCADGSSNANADDFVITFSVAASSTTTSIFSGIEIPLSENGVWDSPGPWADLRKNNGAYSVGLNALARRVTPATSPDHYSEITYDQDPGASSWVGAATRIQSAVNGSGYLAIVYAGEVRLYRADDSGSLNFTQLASASVSAATAPRRLRLESQGNTHRVFFNGTQVITHNATGMVYTSGRPAIAASVFGGPQVKILSFQGDNVGAAFPPPFRFNGQPVGTLAWGTTQATLSLTTGESATCRYSVQPGVAYGSMTNTFTTTGSTNHATAVSGLSNGGSYSFYIRCVDGVGVANPDDFVIAFSVAASSGTTSSFTGIESPLSENGVWDSPGAWTDLRKNDGAYAVGLNALGRRVTPATVPDQYAEITYDQDPGSSSWVGVTTRIQSAANGSGYLAIVYAGEVRLYRADDAGSLNFTMLASASVSAGTAPRRLRLESQGNTHRVSFNGVLLITHNATGTVYTSGQPGVAASVFGGPQVKMLSFESGPVF